VPPPATVVLPSVLTGVTFVNKISKDDLQGTSVELTPSVAKSLESFDHGKGYSYGPDIKYSSIKKDNNLNFTYKSDFTVMFWVKTSDDNSDPVMLGNQDWASSGNKGLTIAYLGGTVRFVVSDGAGNKADFKGGNIKDDKWHLVVLTCDRDGEAVGYIDASPVGNADISAIVDINNSMSYNIAQDGTKSYGDDFTGIISDVRFCNYVMGVAEMSEEMKRY
jgi:hypothetical protein